MRSTCPLCLAQVAMTLRYSHLSPSHLRDAIARLDPAHGAAQGAAEPIQDLASTRQ